VSLDPLLGVNFFVINEMKFLFKKKKKKTNYISIIQILSPRI